MRTILNRLGSVKVTLPVLLMLAGAAAFGTFLPRGGDMEAWQDLVGRSGSRAAQVLGLTDFYHSLWFSALLSVLVVNLVACMASRVPGMLHALSGEAATGREAVLDLPDSEEWAGRVVASLREGGFRPGRKDKQQIFSRGSSGYLYTLLTHGSILVIMAFSILGSTTGFIATKRVYVGQGTTEAFNWKAGGERPLPFELRAEDLWLVPNPVGVRLGVLELSSGRRGKAVTTHVGSIFQVPGIEGRLRLESFDVERKDFAASWTAGDGTRVVFGKGQEIGRTGIALVPVAYATWPERQAVASVTLVQTGGGHRSGEVSVNHPIVSGGIRIYLTDYGQDRFGFPYVGFQFVRDPGQTGVWIGCVLLLLCLPGTVLVRHSCIVLLKERGRLKIHVSSKADREKVIAWLREDLGGPGRGGEGRPLET